MSIHDFENKLTQVEADRRRLESEFIELCSHSKTEGLVISETKMVEFSAAHRSVTEKYLEAFMGAHLLGTKVQMKV